jgi:hypothetical protein
MSNMVFNPYNDFVGVGSTYDTTYGSFGVTAYQNRESITGGYDVEHIIILTEFIIRHIGKQKR